MLARLCLVLLATFGSASAAVAQAKPTTVTAPTSAKPAAAAPTQGGDAQPQTETQEQLAQRVKTLAGKLATAETRVGSQSLSKEDLDAVALQVTPLATEANALVERLTPLASLMKARVDQLGPKPEKGESAEIAKERVSLDKNYAFVDDLLKRAKVLQIKAQQATAYIAKRQHALFTTSLFQRSSSILSPPLWIHVAAETPANLGEASRAFERWLDGVNGKLSGLTLPFFWLAVLCVLAVYWPLTWAARRFRIVGSIGADGDVTEWGKVASAVWTSLTVASALLAVFYAIVLLVSVVAPADAPLTSVGGALQGGVVRIALAAGLARGLLAPGRSKWRIPNLDENTADKLVRIAVIVAVIVALSSLVQALNRVVYASADFTDVTRGVCALLVAAALAAALIDLGDDPEADNPDGEASSPTQRRDIYGIMRGLAWTLILVLVGATVAGYAYFARFLVDQLLLVAAVGTALFLLVSLIDEACLVNLQPGTRLGRTLVYTVGLRRETLDQMPVVISGLARLVLFGLALLIVIAPWGMQSTDLAGSVSAAFFGFKVGDFTISIESIAVAVISFLLVLGATRAVQNWLEDRYLPTTRLDSGLRNSIKTSLGYVGFIIALALGAGELGLDFQKLAIVAGALSVGIGFGLQSVVNNFVSGLILLWERAIRVGDWVVVGSDQGYVRRINVRSTEIETFDRAAVIVPNSNLVSGVVKNLMRTDRVGRLQIELSVHASADPEKVRSTLLAIAGENEAVLSLPAPAVRFTNLTASTMTFDLFCYVADVEGGMRTKSDLYFEICRQFRQNGFFDGPPPDPTAINILGLDRLEQIIGGVDRQVDAERTRTRKIG